MLNVVTLASNIAVDSNATAINLGPSSSLLPNSRIMPGEKIGILFASSDAFDGTVAVEEALDGSTYTTQMAAVDLTTGKILLVQAVAAEYMRLVVASRSAGSVSAYILSGS